MPVLIATPGTLVAVYRFVMRVRNATDMAGDLVDMATDVRLAATNGHDLALNCRRDRNGAEAVAGGR